MELSSSVVGTIPEGAVIVVTEKRFSNTPSYRCVPRLKLRDGSGWISMRINSPPPDDCPVVVLEGLAADGEADRQTDTCRMAHSHCTTTTTASTRVLPPPRCPAPVLVGSRSVLYVVLLAGEEGFSFYPAMAMADGAGGLVLATTEDEQEDDDDDMPVTAPQMGLRRPAPSSSSGLQMQQSSSLSLAASWKVKASGVADSDKIARAFTDIS